MASVPKVTASATKAISKRSRPRGPVLGQWVVDPKKAVAIIDSSGKRMILYPARLPSSKDADLWKQSNAADGNASDQSPTISLQSPIGEGSDVSERSSRRLNNPMDVMMSGMFHFACDRTNFLGGQVLGP